MLTNISTTFVEICQVVSKDGNAIVDEKEYQEMEEKNSTTSVSNQRIKKGTTVGLDDFDSDEETAHSKGKKKNAIVDYKKTISSIGKRSTASTAGYCTSGKKVADKVIITESEKDASDDWLIDDMGRTKGAKASGSGNANKPEIGNLVIGN